MPNTYVALRTETVAVATASVTFSLSGISGYTDLRLVISAKDGSASTFGAAFLRFNSDSTSNYSFTNLYGDGTTAGSTRATSSTSGDILIAGSTASNFGISTVDIFNYSNATTFKTFISRGNTVESYTNARVGLWRKTPEAITSILITSGSGNFAVGSTFSLYGIANADQGSAKATGGIITEDSTYWYHTFGASGTFTPKQALSVDLLVVAGGGGGGCGGGGGGGAGGYRTSTGFSTASGTPISVTVGAGGTGSPYASAAATNGGNSVFSTITSSGGGKGAQLGAANTGGSGGGGIYNLSNAAGNSGGYTPVEGYGGGTGRTGSGGLNSGDPYAAGGGGGASQAGANATIAGSGKGGDGLASSIIGVSVTYAGGGGGGADQDRKANSQGAGGAGGGGAGGGGSSSAAGTAGTANTGGGGGGGANTGNGANGGSGIVIVRYPK